MFLYDYIGSINLGTNIILLLVAGLLVNGPYALITTAVSAELGTHPCLGENSKALATVTAIIDGTGSIGAAVGPLLAGIVSNWGGWSEVFYMLMAADMLALCVSLHRDFSRLSIAFGFYRILIFRDYLFLSFCRILIFVGYLFLSFDRRLIFVDHLFMYLHLIYI